MEKSKLPLLLIVFALLTAGLVACRTDNEPTSPANNAAEAESSTPAGTAEQDGDGTPAGRSFAGDVPAPDFPAGLDWLNTDGPLALADLRGKIVLLDFWTYGCINCLHVIPDLHRLEEKYAEELVIIGVHSAKFENEGETENIRRIIQRYELEHPVINDNRFQVWQEYGAQAWPTFVLIDPRGNIVGYQSGEGIYQLFDRVIGLMVEEFAAELDRTPLELVLERESLANSPLLFPGKVLADPENDRLFIADSNHNRIVVTDLSGVVLEVIGSGLAGLQDGPVDSAQFFRPQGLTLADADTLYVADTENHALRRVNLKAGTVETVVGDGSQGYLQASSYPAGQVGLNSPWDVLYHDGLVYIAMAGQHQLWSYDPETDFLRLHAGSGREELRDGPMNSGGLNQPSGLATDGEFLYFADSEASAIRTAEIDPNGDLSTIVGTGLFDFGDVDGVGDEVRLQHPLGVAYRDGLLYIADTYNSKIKVVDPQARSSETLFGSTAGWQDGVDPQFDEPGGLSIAGDMLYIADTNNHAVRVADLSTGEVSTLVLIDQEGLLTRPVDDAPYPGEVITLARQEVGDGEGTLRLEVEIPAGYKVNDLAPFSMAWSDAAGLITIIPEAEAEQRLVAPSFPLEIPAAFTAGETTLTADLVIYYCDEEAESLCLIEQVQLIVPVEITAGGNAELTIQHVIPEPPIPDS